MPDSLFLEIRTAKLLTYPISLWPTRYRLEDPAEREKLIEAIVEHRGVKPAARELGLHSPTIFLRAKKDPELRAAIDAAQAANCEALLDECISIADEETKDPRSRHIRIETRLRVAGKLLPHLYGDRPNLNVSVHNDNRTLVVTEGKKAELREKHRRLLLEQESNDESTKTR